MYLRMDQMDDGLKPRANQEQGGREYVTPAHKVQPSHLQQQPDQPWYVAVGRLVLPSFSLFLTQHYYK